MADSTHIEWTDATWQPITGCTIVSPGCTNCYAMQLAGTRLRAHPSRAGLTREVNGSHVWTGEVRLNEDWLTQPLRWKRPRRIFVCAHGDLFHESVLDEWIDRVFAVMALSPQHTFQVLTKRSRRMREYVSDWRLRVVRDSEYGLPGRTDDLLLKADLSDEQQHIRNAAHGYRNIWLGVSVEDQPRANERIPDLLETPAATRFLSCEPLLGPLDLVDRTYVGEGGITMRGYLRDAQEPDDFHYWARKLDWLIVGGESGPRARPMSPNWARFLRDQCLVAGAPFFMKQMSMRQAIPADLFIRQFPGA